MTTRVRTVLLFSIFGLIVFGTVPAAALLVGAESVENYSGCGCSTGDLSYCNDQASKFVRKMSDCGHQKKFWYKNGNAWNSDLVEDQLGVGGTDYPYGDTVHILLVSGHGGLSGSTYLGYLCKSSNYNSCNYDTTRTYLGEQAAQAYSSHPGSLRFLILCTCHSVDKNKAPDVWGPVFWRGKNLQYVMGYCGVSADSITTDEVPRDFARKAACSNWTLKRAWFWAIEDWLVDDTGALISRGATRDEAIRNRDEMKLGWVPTGADPYWVAWAWHEG